MRHVSTFLSALLLAPLAAWPASPLAATVSADTVLEQRFLGFGVQWEYEGNRPDLNLANPAWTNHWPEMVRRVDFMQPAILRVMHDARMYTRLERDRPVPDYESPRMEAMYRLLEYARSREIPVLFGEWWLPGAYSKPLGGIASPR